MAADQNPKDSRVFARSCAFVLLICSQPIRAQSGWNSLGMTTRKNARKRARTTTKQTKTKPLP
jgi:hypothetical protein